MQIRRACKTNGNFKKDAWFFMCVFIAREPRAYSYLEIQLLIINIIEATTNLNFKISKI